MAAELAAQVKVLPVAALELHLLSLEQVSTEQAVAVVIRDTITEPQPYLAISLAV